MAEAITRKDIVATVKEKHPDISKAEIDSIVADVFTAVSDAIVDRKKVNVHGFGSFTTSERAARTGRNPQTGGTVDIPASTAAKFSPSQSLKGRLNGKA